LNDSVGANNLTLSGTERYAHDPFFGRKVWVCDGTNYAYVAPAGIAQGADPWSYCLWYKSGVTGHCALRVGTANVAGKQIIIYSGAAGYGIAGVFNTQTPANVYASVPQQLTYAGWQHLCLTYNGSTCIMYQNGIAQSAFSTPEGAKFAMDTKNVIIGTLSGSSSNARAFIADVRPFSVALTAEQVLALAKMEG